MGKSGSAPIYGTPMTKVFQLRLSDDLYYKLFDESVETGKSISDIIRTSVEAHLSSDSDIREYTVNKKTKDIIDALAEKLGYTEAQIIETAVATLQLIGAVKEITIINPD